MRSPQVWFSAAALLIAVSGCGRRLPGSGEVPEPEVPVEVPDSGQEEPCAIGELPVSLAIGEGGRLVVPLAPTGSGATVEVTQVPAGWSAKVLASPLRLTVRAPYDVSGVFGMSLAVRCGEKRVPKGLLIEAHKASWSTLAAWSPSATTPATRQMPTFWIDAANPDRMLMFGGHLYQPVQWTVTNDVWAIDLVDGVWSQVQSANTAPMQASGQVAPIPGSTAVLLHGGDAPAQSLPDALWRFDYGDARRTWTPVSASASLATGSLLGAFVFDEPRNRYISAFGYSAVALSDEVLAFTPNGQGGGAWQKLDPLPDNGQKPSGRYGFAYALDPETDRLIVFSGGQTGSAGNPAQDTWALELAENPPRWVKLASSGTQAPGRRNGCFAFDSVSHRLLVWGGTGDGATVAQGVWALDLDRGAESWHLLGAENEPNGRSSGASAFDEKRNRALFGFGNSGMGIYADVQALNL
ncbi:MAG: Kelch repeat-containing protein [Myxococcaceae bacterium]